MVKRVLPENLTGKILKRWIHGDQAEVDAESDHFLKLQAWNGDWRVVVICPHRGLQFGALTPVQEFVERRVLWVELQPRGCQPPSTPLARLLSL